MKKKRTRRIRSNSASIGQKWICLLVVALFFLLQVHGQTRKIDSLKKWVAMAGDHVRRSEALFSLCEQAGSMNIDTLLRYAILCRQEAARTGELSRETLANVYLETWLIRKNKYDSALKMCNLDLRRISYHSAPEAYTKVTMQKCYILMKTSKRQEALALTYHFLNESEERQDTTSQIYCKYIIGCVYRSMQQTEQALQWFYQAANTGSAAYDASKNAFAVYLQMGGMYNWKAVADSVQKDINADSAMSIYYLDKTIEFSRANENIGNLARALCMKADALEDPQHMALAAAYLKEAIHIYSELDDTLSILNGITAMADYYLNSGQADKGIASCKQGIDIVKRGFSFPLNELSWTLAQCYKKAGNYEKYAETLNDIISLNDITYKKNSEQDLAELNAKYELSNKEAFIAKQKLELLRKDVWITGVAMLTLLLATIAYFLFRRSKRRQIIALAAAEENERKRIAADLHDNIGAYAAAISAGIDEIESKKLISDLSSIQHLKTNATEIITSLRDTIWAFNKESITLTGISDRLKIYIQKMQPAYPQVLIGLEENIRSEQKMSPTQALHIFRIVQEALHNSLQHSHSDRVMIRLTSTSEWVKISIEDNGDGFDPRQVHNQGNGLRNMEARSKEANFDFAIIPSEPRGMKIQLTAKSKAA